MGEESVSAFRERRLRADVCRSAELTPPIPVTPGETVSTQPRAWLGGVSVAKSIMACEQSVKQRARGNHQADCAEQDDEVTDRMSESVLDPIRRPNRPDDAEDATEENDI